MGASIAIAIAFMISIVFCFLSCLVRRRNLQRKNALSQSRTREGNMVVLAGATAGATVAANSNGTTDDERKLDEISTDLGAAAEATVNASQGCCCGGGGCGGGCGGCGGD